MTIAFRTLACAFVALLTVACVDGSPSIRIETVAVADSVAATPATLAAFGPDLGMIMPAGRLQRVPDDAAAMAAVRSGEAVAALIASTDTNTTSDLILTEVETRPVAALVPFTFPVEEISRDQLLRLAAGDIRTWRDLGGPALAVDLAVAGPETVGAALPVASTARAVQDPATALAEQRGRVVLASGTSAGPLVKALRVDGLRPGEPEYPVAMRWMVAGRPGDERAAALGRALAAHRAEQRGPEVVLDAVGDIMLGRGVGETIAARGPRYPFEAIAPLFAGSDVRVGNLELPLTERGERARKNYTFRAPPSSVEGLSAAGFDLVTLANNHTLDYGVDGLLDTLDTLERAGIAHPGAGRTEQEAYRPAVVIANGLRLAFLSYVNIPNDDRSGWSTESTRAGTSNPGVAWGTADAVRRDVAAARGQADLVIVALHSGFEYTPTPNPTQRELAYAAIDAGAALVLGAHPHVLQGIELYKGVPVVYSLGNFIFDVDDDDRRQPGMPSLLTTILRVRLGRDGVRGIELRPATIDQRDGRPIPATGAAARPVYDRIYSLTDALTTRR